MSFIHFKIEFLLQFTVKIMFKINWDFDMFLQFSFTKIMDKELNFYH